jgi:alpha-mannosidase
MTRHHSHLTIQSEFGRTRAGSPPDASLTRRDFLRTGVVVLSGALLPGFLAELGHPPSAQDLTGKRLYIAADDHTDLFWTADLETYENAFIEMLDYYLDLADKTEDEPVDFQSRWNCDGSFWVWIYEKKKSKAEFERLIERIRDGHVSVPLNALCLCQGGAPLEAVLRGMYYPGQLERHYGLRFPLAYAMENQTLPFGLGALWSGSGARFSWKGVCGCVTRVPDAGDREHDIYWWVGPDGSRLLMKWNSMLIGNQSMGGYSEARHLDEVIPYVESDPEFQARYPYQVIGAFGYGWDDLQSQTDEFITAAKKFSDKNFTVIVSNEMDFAEDFEKTYGQEIPEVAASFGNEWDLDCASMAEVSARCKREVERLRTAESLAVLVTLHQNDFMRDRVSARDLTWMNIGLFWEHDWQGAPWDNLTPKRIEWTKKITAEIEGYVDSLHRDALVSLGNMIQNNSANERFLVFNSLSWARTDYADYEYSGSEAIHIVEVGTDQEVPFQFVTKEGKRWLRILAADIPPTGYKVFEIREGAGQSFSNAVDVGTGQIENEFYKLTVDGRGAITSLEDKTRGNREIAAEINGRFINDLGAGAGTIQIENEGPVSVTLLVSAEGPLQHTSRITLFRGLDRIEIQNDITQNFNAMHTWGFGFAIQNPGVYHEEVGAILHARLTTEGGHYSPRNARYDWLTLNHFADINQGNEFGVTLSNIDCYFMRVGNSTERVLDTSTPQLSVLVGANDLNGEAALNDQGGDDHFMQRFALKAHGAYDPAAAMKFALEHQNPLATTRVNGEDGYPSDSYSFLTVDNPNVLLWALKPAEDGVEAGLVARLWNVSGKSQEFSLAINGEGLTGILSLTHIETPVSVTPVVDGKLIDTLHPQQLKTYALFPSQLPYGPDTTGVPTASATAQAVPTASVADTAPAPATETTATPASSSSTSPAPSGCLFGLLKGMVNLFK